jgi:hypothetical protein
MDSSELTTNAKRLSAWPTNTETLLAALIATLLVTDAQELETRNASNVTRDTFLETRNV